MVSSMTEMDDTGCKCGSTRMNFETLDSKIAKGPRKVVNAKFRGKVSSRPKNIKSKLVLPCSRDRSHSIMFAFFKLQ